MILGYLSVFLKNLLSAKKEGQGGEGYHGSLDGGGAVFEQVGLLNPRNLIPGRVNMGS